MLVFSCEDTKTFNALDQNLRAEVFVRLRRPPSKDIQAKTSGLLMI